MIRHYETLTGRRLDLSSLNDRVRKAAGVLLEASRKGPSWEVFFGQAQAVLKQARDDLSKTIMYAPMAGTISDLNKEQGEIAIGSQFQEDVIRV